MTSRLLDLDAVNGLRAAALRFGGEQAIVKSAALAACASREIADPAVLVAYHDCLLCLLAYPETRALRDATRGELKRVGESARKIIDGGSARARGRLANSGVAWTPVTINFGWDIARWLVQRFPAFAEIDSFGEDGVSPQSILADALPPMEFELTASDEPPSEFVDSASVGHRGSRLAWLVGAFERLSCSDALREHLFETLRPFIEIELRDSMLSRTFVRGLPARTFFHRAGLLRKVDLRPLLLQPLPPPRPLSENERLHVVDAGRGMLAALGRETDAIARAHADGVAYFELGRGVAIALYTMRADRRSPIDSHIGMMLFKNGVPVGYGGGWPFLGTCRIGVNVFAPYRGGESAFLFGQVLRLYRQRFGIGRFVAEPSQFGGSNKEGLLSGAFWFYYRLGFRPVDGRSARLAGEEWGRMQADADYRTPLPALRRFTGSDIELRLDDTPACEPNALSETVTGWIGERFAGDRTRAERAAMRIVTRALGVTRLDRWPASERRAFGALAVLFALIPELDRWPPPDKRALVALMRAKGGDEFRFHDLVGGHRRLSAALVTLAARDEA